MPTTPRIHQSVVRRLLLPALSLLLLIGLSLVGPAATAAPAPTPSPSAGTQAEHSAERKHPNKKKNKHKKRHAKKKKAAQAASGSSRVDRAVKVALQQVGDAYRWGGTGPNSFDCSGLMQYSFGKAGIKIPRTASAQSGRAHRIAKSKLRRGDLLYFHRGGRVYHTAMFLKWTKGNAQIVHAPGSGKRVRIDTPWTSSWFAGSMR